MENLYDMKQKLMSYISNTMSQPEESIDVYELGELVDMLKDCFEAEYYCARAKEAEAKTEELGSMVYGLGDGEYKTHHEPIKTSEQAMESLRHVWQSADQNMRARVKGDLQALLNEMK